MILYRRRGTVTKVEEKTQIARDFRRGVEVVLETESCGWFIILDNTVAIPVGDIKPAVEVGAKVIMTVET